MDKRLAGKVALVTGASRGLGYATALHLAREGAHVVATARTKAGLEELDDAIKPLGSSATLVPMDLLDMPSDEAAKALGIRPSTVRVLAARGRATLSAQIGATDG